MFTEYVVALDTKMNPSDRDDATIDIDLTPAPALPGQVFGNPEAIWANVVLDVIL
jgi:hypothetical protein